MIKGVLTNREIVINERIRTSGIEKWMQEKYPSVESVNYMDTTSSAGNWSGIIVQKIKNKNYAVIFVLDNRYPSDGFNLYTHDSAYKLPSDYDINTLCELYDEKVGVGVSF
jgi:hypothetical protein